ncbi:MAG: sensor histidine kinase [Hyphomicrobiales bacterium]|nr:sensor histidine kinase [Hyphomicrobiales bacterium]MBV9431617.1 sensor histidine kinase [Hyphomicrobiales bacterium]MBV9739491.1 sensor histidine kinase [Hyphomicrobiales bacterium]
MKLSEPRQGPFRHSWPLAARLLASAAVLCAAILLVAGFALTTLYRNTAERSFDERLYVYLKEIVATISQEPPGKLSEAGNFGEPRFDLPLSGWYWQVDKVDVPGPSVGGSNSLVGARLQLLPQSPIEDLRGERREGYVEGPDEQKLRIVQRTIDFGDEGRFRIAIAARAEEIDAELRRFDFTLVTAFALLFAALMATTLAQVRFGLRPLSRLSREVQAIRRGDADTLKGDFPRDIAPLAQEINLLLTANRNILERARTQVGNLAHALKTPLAVIMNEFRNLPDAPIDKLAEQTTIMRDQISWHLDRARTAALTGAPVGATPVAPVIAEIARAFEKIHPARRLAILADGSEDLRFRGERQDLQEMVGNLLDNAGKWSSADVRIAARRLAEPSAGAPPRLAVTVDDDGPGLPEAARAEVMRRGMRLDETKPGSGLGLSIVTDIATQYGGKLTLGTSPLGGLRAEVVLPAA